MSDKPTGQPWSAIQIVADITDAMDPQLSQPQRLDAGLRAAKANPALAVMTAVSIARRLVIDSSPAYEGGIPAMMVRVRQVVAARVNDSGGLS